MGQGDHVERPTIPTELERTANDCVELLESKKLRDRKFTHGDDKPRLQELDFIVHPGRAVPDFIRRRDSIAPRGRLAGEAAADRGKINSRANFDFI
jgi:hypothetical protein